MIRRPPRSTRTDTLFPTRRSSDLLSGLTANPLVGRMSDAVTGAGGQAILTEIPEIFGAEHLLMARATDRDTFEALERLVDGFKAYFTAHGEPVSENPSPGNIAGGLTTPEDRSDEHTSELQSLMSISYA